MYIPPHFEETRPGAVAALIEAAPLACVVAHTPKGLVANHLPLLTAPGDAAGGALVGHVALANAMHRVLDEGQDVMAIFRGEDAYVSPNWYPAKAETHRAVPTWNYTVAHLYGTISFSHDDHAKRAAVALLTRAHERRIHGANAWRMADAPPDYMAMMLSNIVAFRITVTCVLAKAKLSQNRDDRDFSGAAEGLRRAGYEGMAGQMEALRTKG